MRRAGTAENPKKKSRDSPKERDRKRTPSKKGSGRCLEKCRDE